MDAILLPDVEAEFPAWTYMITSDPRGYRADLQLTGTATLTVAAPTPGLLLAGLRKVRDREALA